MSSWLGFPGEPIPWRACDLRFLDRESLGSLWDRQRPASRWARHRDPSSGCLSASQRALTMLELADQALCPLAFTAATRNL